MRDLARRCSALIGAAALAGCGSSAAPAPTRPASPQPAASTPAPPARTGAPARRSGCAAVLRAFAQEPRLTQPERLAVEGLIAALARDPAPGRCVSRTVSLPAAGPTVPGAPDVRCLAAAAYVRLLTNPHGPPLSAAVAAAARPAGRAIDAGERHGGRFCLVP